MSGDWLTDAINLVLERLDKLDAKLERIAKSLELIAEERRR